MGSKEFLSIATYLDISIRVGAKQLSLMENNNMHKEPIVLTVESFQKANQMKVLSCSIKRPR